MIIIPALGPLAIASVIGLVLMWLGYAIFSDEAREQRRTAKRIRSETARRWAMTDEAWQREQAERDRETWKFL